MTREIGESDDEGDWRESGGEERVMTREIGESGGEERVVVRRE